MHRHHVPISVAIMFFLFAAAFSVLLWPHVSMAAKLVFFATGVGCGVGIGRARVRGSEEGRS
jgi:hypothetical protein